MNRQRKDVFIPEISKLAVGVAEGQAAKSGADYDDGVEAEFAFCWFGRVRFHMTTRGSKTAAKRITISWHSFVKNCQVVFMPEFDG